MVNSVINSVPGHRLYSLVKPLLMQTHNLKQASVKDKVSLYKDGTQQYLKLTEKACGIIYHSGTLPVLDGS